MVDQASMKSGTNGRSNGSGEGVVSSIAGLGNDIANLAELQAKLALLDLKESTGHAALPVTLVAGGLALLLASLPVALLGVAELVASALSIRTGWAMLLVAGIAAVLAIIVVVVAGLRLRHSFESFRRSREELSRNVAWLRTVLLYSGRSVTRR